MEKHMAGTTYHVKEIDLSQYKGRGAKKYGVVRIERVAACDSEDDAVRIAALLNKEARR
jgi:hypothetical protein